LFDLQSSHAYYLIASEWSSLKHLPDYVELKQKLDAAKRGLDRRECVREMLCRKGMGYLCGAIDIAYHGKQPTFDRTRHSPYAAKTTARQGLARSEEVWYKRLSICASPATGRTRKRMLSISSDDDFLCLSMDEGSSQPTSSSSSSGEEEEEGLERPAPRQQDKHKRTELEVAASRSSDDEDNVAGVDKGIHEAWDTLSDFHLLLAARTSTTSSEVAPSRWSL
jgi:hypothetical protein